MVILIYNDIFLVKISYLSSPPQEKIRTKQQKSDKSKQRTQSAQAAIRTPPRKVNESVQTGDIRGSGARKRLAWSSDGGRSTSPSDR